MNNQGLTLGRRIGEAGPVSVLAARFEKPRSKPQRIHSSSVLMSQRTLLFASAALLFIADQAQADLITWGTPQDATGPGEISQTGTLVAGFNPYASGFFASPTANGVTFDAFAPSGWNNAGTNTMDGSTSGDAGYDEMLNSARATSEQPIINPTDWGGIRLDTISTLTMGETYEIQVWYSEQRPGGNPGNPINDRLMNLSSATGTATLSSGQVSNLPMLTQGPISMGLEGDPNNMSGAGDTIFGQYAIGTFTRTSTDPLYLLIQGVHPISTVNLRPHINAFQIREQSSSGADFCFGDGGVSPGCTNCPCGNNASVGSGGGCLNGSGTSGTLVSSGVPQVTNDTLRFEVNGVNVMTFGILVSGANQLPNVGSCPAGSGIQSPVLDGLRCAGGGLTRHGTRPSDANGDIGVTNNGWGTPSGPVGGLAANGGFTAGQTRHFQVFYREDPALGCQTGQNTTQGVTVTFL